MKKASLTKLFAIFTALWVFAMPPVAVAAGKPVITTVYFDLETNPQKIYIIGDNFADTSSAILGTYELEVTDSTSSLISANLPAVLPAGDYLLTVNEIKNNKAGSSINYGLTIGAVGPQGAAGSANAVGAFVNPDGTVQAATPGVTVTNTAAGRYEISIEPGTFTNVAIPMFMPVGSDAIVTSQITNGTTFTTVQFDKSTLFHFLMVQILPAP